MDSSALNEYLGACDWLTVRHYDVGQSILDEASFSVIVDTAEQRLRYEVRIEHFDSPARSVVSWRQRQEGGVASVTLDFATVSQHRLATHWRVGVDGEGNTPDACSCDLNVAGIQSSHLSRWSRIWSEPDVAKALIDYRYTALQRALEFASASGFSGARFPEASNDLGRENGPRYVLSYPDQDIRREWSVDEVLHISADVCYAVNQYWKVSDDDTFMASRGFEMLIESARFAASVFQWSEGKQAYVVNSVMGPDEYHYHVNNSFFTNYMLRWCIQLALSLCDRPRFPGLPDAERRCWQSIAGNVYLPWITVGGVSIPEEFEGYVALPDTRLRINKKRGPQFADETERDSAQKLQNFDSQLIKQADIILLMSMFPDDFSEVVKGAAFDYYEPRTVHESSLSYGPHAVVAAHLGKTQISADFIARASRYNLDFTPVDEYNNGLHLSAHAGAWQGLVEGLSGLDIGSGQLAFRPRLPAQWDAYHFTLQFRGRRLRISVLGDDELEIRQGDRQLATERRQDGQICIKEERS